MTDTYKFDDDREYNGDITINGTLTLGANKLVQTSSATGSTTAGASGILEGAFVVADINAGTKAFTNLPAGAIVRGCSVKVTTQLAYANGGAGDTTDVTVKAGTSGDDDAWLKATALDGAVGAKYPTAGGDGIGMATSGGNGKFTLTFTASAGSSPDLSDVSAGAGTVYIDYVVPA